MRDYKLSEVMNICRRHTCATCPLVLHSGACRFVNVSSPVNWNLDDVPDSLAAFMNRPEDKA